MDNHKTDKQQSSNTANIINFIHSIQTPVETDDFTDTDAMEFIAHEVNPVPRECYNCGTIWTQERTCHYCGDYIND